MKIPHLTDWLKEHKAKADAEWKAEMDYQLKRDCATAKAWADFRRESEDNIRKVEAERQREIIKQAVLEALAERDAK